MAKAKKSTRKTGKSAASGASKSGVIRPAAFNAPDLNALLINGATNKAMETIMTKSKDQMERLTQDASEFGREGFDAFMKSGTLFAKGFEDIIRTSIELAQGAAEKQSKYIKDAMSCKTLNEFAETQNKIAQANFDDFMASATKISEMSARLLTQASEPLNAQATKSMKKASEKMAA